MTDTPAESQGRPHPDRLPKADVDQAVTPHNPGGLMPDLRGEAVRSGRDPEELDPLRDDEDHLRRESGDPGVLKP